MRTKDMFLCTSDSEWRVRGDINASWDYGRLKNLPLFPECVILDNWQKKSYFIHHNTHLAFFEIPLSGDMRIEHRDTSIILTPGNVYYLPQGEPNRLSTGPSGSCRKLSIGICGTQFPILRKSYIGENFTIHIGRKHSLQKTCFEIFSLLKEKDVRSVPHLTGLTMEFLAFIGSMNEGSEFPGVLMNILRSIESNLGKQLRIGELAKSFGMSEYLLLKMFRKYLNTTPKRYQLEQRMKKAAAMLEENSLRIKEIAYLSGYSTPLIFSQEFRKFFGVYPRQYTAGGISRMQDF